MSSPKHTPGPWHTFRQGTKHFVSQAADDEFRFAHAVLFETNYHPDGIAAARKEAEANARLIAAAPDLLVALQQALSLIDAYRRVSGGDGDSTAATVRAAIAKATGGAP